MTSDTGLLLPRELDERLGLSAFQLPESQLTQRLFAQIIRRIERLACHPT